MHVCVLGAGIIGLSTAYELTQRGHQVTVIDRAAPAAGASGGNGAQLSYSYVQPLADPGIWAQLPKLLLSPSSALKIRPQWDTRQWAWVWQFLHACNAQQSHKTTAELLTLAAQSRQVFDALRQRENIDVDYTASGKLVLFRTEATFAAARQQMLLQQQLGGESQRAVTASEACAIEPALAHQQNDFTGAIYTDSECAADCKKVCEALAAILKARGAALRWGQAFRQWVSAGDRLAAVQLDNGDEVVADAFVLCTGHTAPALAASLDVELPIYPLKGYSITVPTDGTGLAPKVNITDSARKIVFSRLGQRLRAAGMVELVGQDASVQRRQIETLQQATQALFPDCSRYTDIQPWAGMRPATPTGLPIVGHQGGPRNLFINAGQGALGFTLAFGSATQLANTLC
ncbi:D-amino acid dehydrogenase [Limnohabitans sp. 2KL-27]|uniref:D-amino acid dehydrogenase n=1 Tax=Limnohabitans sp. 2KL-27 TaxID=1100705 RepID=UPI000A57D5D8|nr:D-amino acid dehydrogenase [Limnohabitans sp. 2KL-27]